MKGVVAAPQVEAAEVARSIFLDGGNAVDAAVAVAFAQGVVDPQMTSLGGWGMALIYHPPSGQHLALDFCGRAPLKATPDMWASQVKRRLRFDLWELEGHINEVGYLAVTVPGNVAGYWELHRRFGKLPWKAVVEPAIALAEEGFAIPGELANLWRRPPAQEGVLSMREILTATPASARLFTKDGHLYEAGEWFRNPDYANTLREVAQHGPQVFYEGWLAQKIVDDFTRNGGLLTLEDFKTYQVKVKPPVESTYRGVRISGTPPPSSSVQVMEILNILEGFDPRDLPFGSPNYAWVMALAQKASFVDRVLYLGDPDFQPVPIDLFLSKSHAAQWREKVLRNVPFDVPSMPTPEPAHTTTVSAVDEEGTAVAITHTLSTPASGVVVEGLGFMFNNAMMAFHPFPGHPNSIAPGKARITGMAPMFLWKDKVPWAVISAPGGTRILTAVLQTIVNLVDYRMTPVEAVSAPRLHCEGPQVDIEARLYFAVKDSLARRGLTPVKSAFSYDPLFALVHVAMREADGRLTGAADPRGRGGLVVVG